MKNKYIYLTIALLILTVGLNLMIVFRWQKTQSSTTETQKPIQVTLPHSNNNTTPAGTVDLAFEPTNSTVNVGEKLIINIMASSDSEVLTVDLILKYDPQILEIVNFQKGDFFINGDEFVNQIDPDNQVIILSQGGANGINPKSPLATIEIMTKEKIPSTEITLHESSVASNQQNQELTVDTSQSVSITVN